MKHDVSIKERKMLSHRRDLKLFFNELLTKKKGVHTMKMYSKLIVTTGDPVKSKPTKTYSNSWDLPEEELKVLEYLYNSYVSLSNSYDNPVLTMSASTIAAKTGVPLNRIPNILDVLQNSGFIKMLWRVDDLDHVHKDIYLDEKKCRGVPIYKDTPKCASKTRYVSKACR